MISPIRGYQRALVLSLCIAAPASRTVAQTGSVVQEPGVEAAVRLFDQGDYSAAKARLLEVTRGAPDNAAAAFYLGRIYLSEGSNDQSVAWLERAVRADPRNSKYHNALGQAYASQARTANRLRQAMLAGKIKDQFATAVSLDPDNIEARMGLMQFYLIAPGIMGGSVDRARDQAAEIRKRNPLEGLIAAAIILEKENDRDKAQTEYESAVREFPDSTRGYYQLAAFYRKTQQYDKAFALLDELQARHPNQIETLYHIGSTGAQSGRNLDRSAEALRTYLSKPWLPPRPTPVSAHFRLGQIYEKQGDRVRARKEYQTVLELDPNYMGAKEALAALK